MIYIRNWNNSEYAEWEYSAHNKSERNLNGISLRLLADSIGILITTTKLHIIDQQHRIAY